MKFRISLIALSFMFAGLLAQVSLGQKKEITYEEYGAAERSADRKEESTYPRIETYTFKSDEPRDVWFREINESAKRSYRDMKITTAKGTEHTQDVYFDGEVFQRVNDGVWATPRRDGSGTGSGNGNSQVKYTVESVVESGKEIKLYTRTATSYRGRIALSWIKVDAAGRLIESYDNDDGERHAIYEYPAKVKAIFKPKLGTKQDI